MKLTNSAELLQKGLLALEHGHTYLAMTCLEQAMEDGETPVLASYLAYCRALNGRDLEEAAELARGALHAAPADQQCCLNLGRILLLSGHKDQAIAVFRQGLAHSLNPVLIAQLEQLGTRKPPLFVALPRDHFLNKYGGKVLSLLGFR
jgi:tetratricopeptide (TPR) repeat protein